MHYRTRSKACYASRTSAALTCYDVTQADPLFAEEMALVPEDEELSRFFGRVLIANRAAIALNRVVPAPQE